MCLPLLGLVGAAISAAGTMASANAQAQQDKYNAKVARINAHTARQQGNYEADQKEDEYQKVAGEQTAGYAKAGIDPTGGSPDIVKAQSYANSWMDQHTAIWNRETEAVGFENQAQALEYSAKQTKKAGALGAASSLVGGLAGAAKGFGGGGGGFFSPISITG
jgi:hypothetical protein